MGRKVKSKYFDSKLRHIFYSHKLASPFPPRVHECPEISQSSQKLSPSVFMVVWSGVRAMLPRATLLWNPGSPPEREDVSNDREGLVGVSRVYRCLYKAGWERESDV